VPSILFLHTNYPAQFGFLAMRLAEAGWNAAFATQREGVRSEKIKIVPFRKGRDITGQTHQYVRNTERAVINGQEAARVLLQARDKGYKPDIVMAHSGWGPGIFIRDIWPDAIYIPYLEWWYNWPLVDVQFLGDGTHGYDTQLRQRVRNIPQMLDLSSADFGIVPTQYQASQFPPRERQILRVIHDGVDTKLAAPAGLRRDTLGDLPIGEWPEIVTYATRGMEPQRGFPQFMRALALLQKRRPKMHAIIAGEDRVAYGKALPEGETWKKKMLAELDLDMNRVHFTGRLPRPEYQQLLQASHAHVYLTVPFVLSWSMLEAMSTACPMVVSDTPPVHEFMRADETGLMVDFHKPQLIANRVEELLDDRALGQRLGVAAREVIVENYDLEDIAVRKRRMLEDALEAKRAG